MKNIIFLKTKKLKETLRKDSLRNIVVIPLNITPNTSQTVWEIAEPWETQFEEDLDSDDCTCE